MGVACPSTAPLPPASPAASASAVPTPTPDLGDCEVTISSFGGAAGQSIDLLIAAIAVGLGLTVLLLTGAFLVGIFRRGS